MAGKFEAVPLSPSPPSEASTCHWQSTGLGHSQPGFFHPHKDNPQQTTNQNPMKPKPKTETNSSTTPTVASGCGSRSTTHGGPILHTNAKAILPATYNIQNP
jgi:hypothetical protein